MWARLDDSFPDHPKILAAGPLCALIQVRAICYCSRYLTDGLIPRGAVSSLVSGLERLGIETGRVGDGEGGRLASFGVDADEVDWPAEMVKHRLWDEGPDGYRVHDFLDYNPPRSTVERERVLKSDRMRRWKNKETQPETRLETPPKTQPETRLETPPPSPSPSYVVSGSSSALPATNNTLEVEQEQARKEARKPRVVLTDDQFMAALRANEAYKHLDLDEQLGKMDAWLSCRPGRQKTRRFIVRWLNSADRPVNDNGNYARAMKTRTDMSGLRAFAEKRRAP